MYKQNTGIDAYQVEFTGEGGEFFRVWIVNVLLSLVTLGIYTPFARRRTAQYFYGHTLVAGSPLEFTAQQRKMVLGFLLFVALYIAFKIAAETEQDAALGVMMLGGAVLAPYFWASAMRFRLNNTRWRGVRLQFTASWWEVYRASWPVFAIAAIWFVAGVLLVMPLMPGEGDAPPAAARADLVPLVLGVVLALALTVLCLIRLEFNYKSLLVARGRIGGQAGRWKPVFGDFVRIGLATAGVFLLAVLLMVVVVVVGIGTSALLAGMKGAGIVLAVLLGAVVGFLAIVLGSAPARAYRDARMFQLVWNNIGVSRIARFKCDLPVWRYVRLRVMNILLTLVTLGLYRPFAMVSEYRVKASSVTLHVKGGLDQLAGQLAREEQGLGDAFADVAGLDLVG